MDLDCVTFQNQRRRRENTNPSSDYLWSFGTQIQDQVFQHKELLRNFALVYSKLNNTVNHK